MTTDKARVLLVGGGGVGVITALNLERGGRATVTAVLRGNYQVVQSKGFTIKSCDHGVVEGWRPTEVVNQVPNATGDGSLPYDYIVVTTKNCPDVKPHLTDLIKPAVTPEKTVIVLIQNGLNIEELFYNDFPDNVVLSGVNMIGSNEKSTGVIEHVFADELLLGPFENPFDTSSEFEARAQAAAKHFVEIYSAGGKTKCTFDDKVRYSRWRKLVYNACLNPICALTRLDTGRIRQADDTVETLVRPAMEEIRAAAKAAGYDLPDDIADFMINIDPLEDHLKPSMLVDAEKGNYIEFHNLVGEPLREGRGRGVQMPKLEVIYSFCKAYQLRLKAERGYME